MKEYPALIWIVGISFFLYTSALAQVDSVVYIWGGPGNDTSEFNGGLHGWTTQGWSTQNDVLVADSNAVWRWTDNPTPLRGFITGNPNYRFRSKSVQNGFAYFDSDWYDNDGLANNFGKGASPAPQRGLLISPIFSCEGHSSVVVFFHQYLRTWRSGFYLDVSVDSGKTWVEFELNKDPFIAGRYQYTWSANRSWNAEIIDISSVAANQPAVQIRFRFEANYYFWMIDDVYVLEMPKGEVVLGDIYYPPRVFDRPVHALTLDTAFVGCYVANRTDQPIDSLVVQVSIRRGNEQGALFDAYDTISLGSKDTVFVDFGGQYVLPDDWPEDRYTISYAILREDFNPTDNEFGLIWDINDGTEYRWNIYKGANIGFRPRSAGNTYAICPIFYTGEDAADYTIGKARVAVGGRNIFTSDNAVEVYLLEFHTFDPQFVGVLNGDFVSIDQENSDYTIVAYGYEDLSGKEWGTLFDVALENELDDQAPVRLKPNTMYILAIQPIQADNSDKIYVGFGRNYLKMHSNIHLFPFARPNYLVFNDGWRPPFGNVPFAPIVELSLEFDPVKTRKPQLTRGGFEVLSNPVYSTCRVRLKEDVPIGKSFWVLTDMNHRVLWRHRVVPDARGEQQLHFSGLPTGTYVLYLNTPKGYAVEKIIKI